MLFALLRTRIKALVVTLLIGLAAPRVARALRGYGQRRSLRGDGGVRTTTVPLTAADLLDKLAVWARPPKKERRRR